MSFRWGLVVNWMKLLKTVEDLAVANRIHLWVYSRVLIIQDTGSSGHSH